MIRRLHAIHVVPVKQINNSFETFEECRDFVDEHTSMAIQLSRRVWDDVAYFGHTLSKDCSCKPEHQGASTTLHTQGGGMSIAAKQRARLKTIGKYGQSSSRSR